MRKRPSSWGRPSIVHRAGGAPRGLGPLQADDTGKSPTSTYSTYYFFKKKYIIISVLGCP